MAVTGMFSLWAVVPLVWAARLQETSQAGARWFLGGVCSRLVVNLGHRGLDPELKVLLAGGGCLIDTSVEIERT